MTRHSVEPLATTASPSTLPIHFLAPPPFLSTSLAVGCSLYNSVQTEERRSVPPLAFTPLAFTPLPPLAFTIERATSVNDPVRLGGVRNAGRGGGGSEEPSAGARGVGVGSEDNKASASASAFFRAQSSSSSAWHSSASSRGHLSSPSTLQGSAQWLGAGSASVCVDWRDMIGAAIVGVGCVGRVGRVGSGMRLIPRGEWPHATANRTRASPLGVCLDFGAPPCCASAEPATWLRLVFVRPPLLLVAAALAEVVGSECSEGSGSGGGAP